VQTDLESPDTNENPQDSGNPTEETPVVDVSTEDLAVEQPDEQDAMASLPEWAQKQIRDLRAEAASRRVENKTINSQNEQLTTLFQQLAQQVAPSEEPESAEESPANVTPDRLTQVVDSMMETLNSLSRENQNLRVSQETGLPLGIVQGMKGDTYEDLLATAGEVSKLIGQGKQGATSVPLTKPPKVPSGDQAVGMTDAQRRDKYFGSGPSNAGVFAKNQGGGVVTYD